MRKSTVVKLFVSSLIGMAASAVLFVVAGTVALGNDVFVMDGPDVVGIKTGLLGWAMIGLAGVAVLGMVAAVTVQFVAWVGAVLSTAQLPDKTWFVVVLAGGLVSLGFLATLAYVIGGPNDEHPVTDPLAQRMARNTAIPAAAPNERTPVLVHH